MSRKLVCRAQGGVMYCRNARCPEKLHFFEEYVHNLKAEAAVSKVIAVQRRMRAAGMKALTVTGVDDLLPDVSQPHAIWTTDEMTRLKTMLWDEDDEPKHIEGKVEKIKLSDVKYVFQGLVKFSALVHYLNNDNDTKHYGPGTFSNKNLPVIIRNGKDLVLVDGTHRFVKNRLLEHEYMEAVIAELV